jgi:DNA polymerase-3 subunit gamma/tau
MTDQSAHYTVLARRFRPTTFADVVGQQHIAQALQNAIRSGRVAHAYLFTGARGVGKTSTARILAKALNCPDAQDGVPCNNCEICDGISAGNDVDVLEIDGASNRGIDDIRSLRANVNVKSMRTKYKLYIIDEVHMLTREAFNALLKTLEEPPPNVKFVFCTTEPNKVPDTILSRCQRFDFATIDTTNIVARLQTIAAAEGYEVEPEALELIARRAAGSMRDSQSLFDQLLAFSEGKITSADVHRLLGTASDDRLIGLFDAVIDRRRADVLSQLDQALAEGVQLNEMLDQLLSFGRDLMVTATNAESVELLSVSVAHRQALTDRAHRWGLETIVAAMQILAETKGRMARSTYGRALLELALIRISMLEDLTRIGSLLAGMPPEANAPASQTPPSVQTTSTPPSSPAPASPPPPPADSDEQPEVPEQKSDSANPPVAKQVAKQVAPRESPVPNSKKKIEPTPPDRAIKGVEPSVSEVSPDPSPADYIELRPASADAIFAQLLENMDDTTRKQLQHADVSAIFGPNRLDLTFPLSYHFCKLQCEKPEVVTRLQQAVESIVGKKTRIVFHLSEEKREAPVVDPTTTLDQPSLCDTDDYVQKAVDLFGGKLVKVENIGAVNDDE